MKKYLILSIIASVAYSLVAPLLKVAMVTIPSTTAVFLSNVVLLIALSGILIYQGVSPVEGVNYSNVQHIIAWGITLGIGLLAYYRALELGPVSIVVPIYGLFIAFSSILGIVILNENLTHRKFASIIFAIFAIVLMSI